MYDQSKALAALLWNQKLVEPHNKVGQISRSNKLWYESLWGQTTYYQSEILKIPRNQTNKLIWLPNSGLETWWDLMVQGML